MIDLGHLRIEWTRPLKRLVLLAGMMEDMIRHIKQCERCLRFKAVPDKAPLENVDAKYPMEFGAYGLFHN